MRRLDFHSVMSNDPRRVEVQHAPAGKEAGAFVSIDYIRMA